MRKEIQKDIRMIVEMEKGKVAKMKIVYKKLHINKNIV